jgi:hypothetical protein
MVGTLEQKFRAIRFDSTWLEHSDPRLGHVKRSSQRSDELLSVRGVFTQHPMQHAHKVRWQTPITEAPHLSGRSRFGDPPTLRALRPLIMMCYLSSRLSMSDLSGLKQWRA